MAWYQREIIIFDNLITYKAQIINTFECVESLFSIILPFSILGLLK